MSKLSPQRQRFVLALLADDRDNGTRAAIEAGYSKEPGSAKSIASRLRHDPAVLAAIGEVARSQLWSLRALASRTVQHVLNDPLARNADKIKAAQCVFDRTDLPATTEQKITVEHKQDRQQQIRQIAALAKQLQMDPAQLLGRYGVTIDAEFEEVTPLTPIPGLEDVT
jgi:phage terminase small subunit